MVALDFPNSPTVGQTYPSPPVAGVPTYTWNGTSWNTNVTGGAPAIIYISDTPPAGVPNSLWWESDTGLLYVLYNDGDSTQWVLAAPPPGSVTNAIRYDLAQSLTSTQQNQAQKNIGLAAVVRSYLAGLTLTTAGSSASFAVAAGVAADSTNVDMMTLAASLAKTTAAWAVGAAAGALDTGAIAASTWYHVHLIKNIATQIVDALISLSATAPTLPSGYSLARRIGSMKTNASSQWTLFRQDGDEFQWDVPTTDYNSIQNPGTAAILRVVNVPLGVRVKGHFAIIVQNQGTASQAFEMAVTDPQGSDNAAGVNNLSLYTFQTASGNIMIVGAQTDCFTNTSGQVRTRAYYSDTNYYFYLSTLGWRDRRGQDN